MLQRGRYPLWTFFSEGDKAKSRWETISRIFNRVDFKARPAAQPYRGIFSFYRV